MPDHDPATQTAQGLHKIALVMRHHAWKAASQQGLSPTQAQALVALRSATGPLRLSALADALSITPATVSEAVTALEEKGLISKSPASDDRRAIALRLTHTGKREAGRVAMWPDAMLDAIGGLDAQEHAVLQRTLIKMIRSLQDRGAVPVARMCVNCSHFRPHAHPGNPKPHHCALLEAPIGDADLRLDCDEVELIDAASSARLWQAFVEGKPLDGEQSPRALSNT